MTDRTDTLVQHCNRFAHELTLIDWQRIERRLNEENQPASALWYVDEVLEQIEDHCTIDHPEVRDAAEAAFAVAADLLGLVSVVVSPNVGHQLLLGDVLTPIGIRQVELIGTGVKAAMRVNAYPMDRLGAWRVLVLAPDDTAATVAALSAIPKSIAMPESVASVAEWL